MSAPLNVALVGTGFMGRAHSNAWMSVNPFFAPARAAVRRVVCARETADAKAFAARWGWERATASLREILDDDRVDLVDVTTPNHLHAAHTIAALDAGKHVACEKPLAGTLADARSMRDAAARVRGDGARTFVWFNYRRCPAMAFAHAMVAEGRLGRIYHVRGKYLQDWGGPQTPHSWRFDVAEAGSGVHGDLNAHVVDLARFVTGDEIVEIAGALTETFVAGRAVDDCSLFLTRFGSGAVGSFEATRLAPGNRNRNSFEINGADGSIRFDFERMNELEWFDNTAASARRGWTRILCTNPGDHPYVEAYWPPGHGLGYEHQFVSQAADIIESLSGGAPVVPLPDFEDAYRTQLVLHAALVAAAEGRAVQLDEIDEA